jgi:hypothetical protein
VAASFLTLPPVAIRLDAQSEKPQGTQLSTLRNARSPLQIGGDLGQPVEGGLEVFRDFGGYYVGIGEVGGVLQAFVFQPEDIQVDLVAVE